MPKKKPYIPQMVLPLLILLAASVILSSCEDSNSVGPDKYANVYMPQARENPAQRSVRLTAAIQTVPYGAVYGGTDKPGRDIMVHFRADTPLVSSYNTTHGTTYPLLPKASYTLSKKAATIPAGHISTPSLSLKLQTAGNISRNTKYLLPITMSTDGQDIVVNEKLKTTYYVISGSYVQYDKSSWQITDYDSFHAGYPPANIIDGDEGSFWNTEYQPVDALPHYASVDMGKINTVSGFKIVGRQSSLAVLNDQNPKEITIQFSDDGQTWQDGEDFTLPFNDVFSTRIFLSKPIDSQYFKIIINSTVGGGEVLNLNEIYAF